MDIIYSLIEANKNRWKTNVEKLAEAEKTEPQNTKFLATANMFRLVYAECMLNIPLYQHQNMVQLLKQSNVKLGTHHYERTSASRMLLTISDSFHFKLLNHLSMTRYPISLIIDATTDNRGKHHLIFYLRSLEADKKDGVTLQLRPVLYFYKLLEFGMEENAVAHLNMLITTFQGDQEKEIRFEETIRHNLVAFGSDGANVMIGKHIGLIVKLTNTLVEMYYLFIVLLIDFTWQPVERGKTWNTSKHLSRL